ncbi:3-dehydroquinate synthase family protein [Streptomyces sp. NPDC002588]|uniref:3-dehydroquinate synthase family protein n=1 Tax=Streptomyces sp. NPDC002588 TaxID=3154419 RepID=UPI00331B114D
MTFPTFSSPTSVSLRSAGPAPYPVVLGRGLHEQAGRMLGDRAPRVAIVHPPKLAGAAGRIAGDLERTGRQVLPLVVPPGEAAKDAGVVVYLWSQLGESGFTAADAVVALGGGATVDLAGFLAATWQGGISLVLAPATPAGMVRAGVGGRSALNVPQGKNLAGVHHPPIGAVCDLDLLRSLPPAEHTASLAEIVKTGLIADPALLDLIESDPRAATDPTAERAGELIEGALRAQIAVAAGGAAAGDGSAGDTRVFLDYGHTLAHAVEYTESYRVRHGHAVSVGMVFAAELARAAGRLDAGDVQRHRSVLAALGLPTSHPRYAWERLRAAFAVDGLTRGTRLGFVVLDALGSPALLEDPDPGLLDAAYARTAG